VELEHSPLKTNAYANLWMKQLPTGFFSAQTSCALDLIWRPRLKPRLGARRLATGSGHPHDPQASDNCAGVPHNHFNTVYPHPLASLLNAEEGGIHIPASSCPRLQKSTVPNSNSRAGRDSPPRIRFWLGLRSPEFWVWHCRLALWRPQPRAALINYAVQCGHLLLLFLLLLLRPFEWLTVIVLVHSFALFVCNWL